MLFCQFSRMPIGHFSGSGATIMHIITRALVHEIANESMRITQDRVSFSRAIGRANVSFTEKPDSKN